MVIKISQLKANGQNWFEISDANGVLYYAKAPWMDVRLPLNAENIRQLVMLDKDSNIVYKTEYSILENALEEALPLKFLWTEEQRFGQYSVVSNDGPVGSFYSKQNGIFDGKYCINNGGTEILGYTISKGNIEVVSFYQNGRQIAQITKPTAVRDNLDTYYLHLVDDMSSLMPVLAFFTVFYDYQNHNDSGRFTAGRIQISHSYTFDENNKYYDPAWIEKQFGVSEADRFKKEINSNGGSLKKKILTIFLVAVPAAVVALIITVNFLLQIFAWPTAVSRNYFADVAENMGYFVVNEGYQTVSAHADYYEIKFYTFEDDITAQKFYHDTVEGYETLMNGTYTHVKADYWTSVVKDEWFYYVCRVENTVLWAEVPSEYAGEVKAFRKAIGY